MPSTSTQTSGQVGNSIKYGRSIVRFYIGPTSEVFTIHEDLLCSKSLYFRDLYQKNRKPIEGDCCICHEKLGSGHREVTFCTSCGGNIHYGCIQRWKSQMQKSNKIFTCPLCRDTPQNQFNMEDSRVCRLSKVNEAAFHIYSQWIYNPHIPIPALKSVVEEPYHCMADAYLLGISLRDFKFRVAVIESMLRDFDNDSLPSAKEVRYIYGKTDQWCNIRNLLVQMYISAGGGGICGSTDNEFPIEFLKDTIQVLVDASPDLLYQSSRYIEMTLELEQEQEELYGEVSKRLLS